MNIEQSDGQTGTTETQYLEGSQITAFQLLQGVIELPGGKVNMNKIKHRDKIDSGYDPNVPCKPPPEPPNPQEPTEPTPNTNPKPSKLETKVVQLRAPTKKDKPVKSKSIETKRRNSEVVRENVRESVTKLTRL